MTTGRVDGALVGRRIRARREAAGLSLGQVAQYAPVSKAYLSRLENGKLPRPSATKLSDIARVLNCTVQDLIAPDSDARTTEVAVPVEKAPIVRRLLRYSASQLDKLAEAAGTFFTEPVPDDETDGERDAGSEAEDGKNPPSNHAAIAWRVGEMYDDQTHFAPAV